MNYAIRLPVAFVLGRRSRHSCSGACGSWSAATVDFGDLKPAVKIDFSRAAPRHRSGDEARRKSFSRNRKRRRRFRRSRASAERHRQRQCQFGERVVRYRGTSVTAFRSVPTVTSFRWCGSTPNTRTGPASAASRVGYRCSSRSRRQGPWQDQKVVDADPKGLFESAALEAIGRWKYNPKVVDGRAMERRGVHGRIDVQVGEIDVRPSIALAVGLVALSAFSLVAMQDSASAAEEKSGKREAPPIDISTGKKLNEAIEALNAQKYAEAKAILEHMNMEKLSPYEQSRVLSDQGVDRRRAERLRRCPQEHAGARSRRAD